MKRLRKLRLSLKLSQKEVANILGISRQAYNRYELGQRNPDNTMLIKLATFYNVSIDYLLEKTELKKTATVSEDKLNTNYLELAYELQELNIDPNDIRTIANIIAKQNK